MITWHIDPEIFSIGPFSIRWYGLLFALSFLFGYHLIRKIFLKESKPEAYLDQLFLYVFIGTVVGARLGHCLFYDPVYYLSNPIELLKTWRGGLASHGAAIGILAALYFFQKKKKDISFLWITDRLVIIIALAGALIRTGNFFNSEIIGNPTNVPWAIIFSNVDAVPRHPTQLYEALAYLSIFILLYWLYQTRSQKLAEGFLFGLFLTATFGFRFLVEFLKVDQSSWEASLPLNMGQLLSIPLFLLGLYLLLKTYSVSPPPPQAASPTPSVTTAKAKKKRRKQ